SEESSYCDVSKSFPTIDPRIVALAVRSWAIATVKRKMTLVSLAGRRRRSEAGMQRVCDTGTHSSQPRINGSIFLHGDPWLIAGVAALLTVSGSDQVDK